MVVEGCAIHVYHLQLVQKGDRWNNTFFNGSTATTPEAQLPPLARRRTACQQLRQARPVRPSSDHRCGEESSSDTASFSGKKVLSGDQTLGRSYPTMDNYMERPLNLPIVN